MTNKLDKFYEDLENKSKKVNEEHKKYIEEAATKKEKFNSDFKDLLANIVIPNMSDLLKEIHKRGNTAQVHNNTANSLFKTQGYLLKKGPMSRGQATVMFVGNNIQNKVYINIDYSNGVNSKSVENKYDIIEVTPELIVQIVTEALNLVLK